MTDLTAENLATDTMYLSIKYDNFQNLLFDERLLFMAAFSICFTAWSWIIYGMLK